MDKERLMAFLKNCLLKELGKILTLSRYQLRMLRGLLTGHCHLKGRLLAVLYVHAGTLMGAVFNVIYSVHCICTYSYKPTLGR
jgi:hypothetical protein